MTFPSSFFRRFLVGSAAAALALSGAAAAFAQQQEEPTGQEVQPKPPTLTRPRPALPP